jgi:hypothetical protein
MQYRRLGRTGLMVFRAVPRVHDVRARAGRGELKGHDLLSKTKVLEEDRSFYRGDYAISV